MIGPILKGKKVILKPIKVNEAKNYLRWSKDPKVTKFLSTFRPGLSLKKEKEIIKNFRKSKTEINWSIYTMAGRNIGGTSLIKLDAKKIKKATYGIFIGEKNYWGQGYGTDILKTVLKFAFNKLKLNRVELGVFYPNKRGVRCYIRCGFKREGRKREAAIVNGKYVDVIGMGILKREFKKMNIK